MTVDKIYVMKYPDGKWVRRDDSSGPMSTGGYPFPTDDLRLATQWTSIDGALKYKGTCKEPWTLHMLTMSTIEIPITPAMEAKATGDTEFIEFLRLKRKYGEYDEQCPFIKSWVGKCKVEPEIGELYCPTHKDAKCGTCGAQATHDCEATIGAFVCGGMLCAEHRHSH